MMNNSTNPSTSRSTTRIVLSAARSRLVRAFHEFNLFSDHPIWSSALTHAEQILSTQAFLIHLFISLLIVIVYVTFAIRTHEVTLDKFSLAEFERLEVLHPTTINVPCTQLSIPFHKFVKSSSHIHQVCSSSFVSQEWISSLFLSNATSHNILDFRTFTFAQFRALALLCHTVRQAVNDAQRAFGSTHLTTTHVLSRSQFIEIMDVIISNFKRNVKANENRITNLVSISIAENRALSALRTNYYIQSVPGSRSYLTMNGAYLNKNKTIKHACYCRLEQNRCIYSAGVYDKWTPPGSLNSTASILPPRIQIPGLMAGCLPLDTIYQSTLECLYNQSCVNILTLQPHISRPKALNASSSEFLVNATIESMFKQSLFVESWQSTPNFEKYFAACAPRSLSYSYEDGFFLAMIFTICVSAFGGLVVGWQLISPLIVKVWKRIKWKQQQAHPTVQLNPMSVEGAVLSVAPRPINEVVVTHVRKTIYTFNLFPSDDDNDDPEEERVGIIATRLYILCLLISLPVLIFYIALEKQTKTYNIPSPSLAKFEELNLMYSSTLECPCTHMSISYARIISIVPRYHQVCSSEFLKDYWLSYFGPVLHGGLEGAFLTPDFRVSGQSFFELLSIFCKEANKKIEAGLLVFRSTRLFTASAISRAEFDLQTSTRMERFKQHIISSCLVLAELVHSSIRSNRLVTEMLTSASPISSFDNQTSKWSLRFRTRRFYSNSCLCSLSDRCTRPIGFYSQLDTVHSQPNITVPGLVVGCYPIDSFLLSTLECLFDRQCLKLIIDNYDFDVVNLVRPLDERAINIQPLHDENSRFPPNTTIEMIFSELFVEEWKTTRNYASYYARCAPIQCTYKMMRFDTPYIATMMLGFYGGLSIILEFILPPAVKIVRRWWRKSNLHQERNISPVVITGTTVDLNNKKKTHPVFNVFQKFWSLNLFTTDSSSTNERHKHQEIVATRVYLLLFIVCLTGAILYAGPLSEETDTTIIPSPTPDTVNNLYNKNISTLSCPCSTAAVSYSKFLTIIPHYHSICSSQFISPSYWSHIFNKGDNISLELTAHCRILASLCNIAHRVIENTKEVFGTREMISVETVSRSSFYTQTNAIVSTFITQTPADFRRTLSFIVGSFGVNQLLNVFSSNWEVAFSSQNEYYLIATHPRRFSSSNCTCATSSDCTEQLGENVFSGCFPFDGFRLSKLDNYSMEQLINKLFVEKWQNQSNYTAYFDACRPTECRYTLPDRNNLLYMLTTVLGLYGGLTYALRLLVGQSLLGYRWWKKHIQQEQIQITSTQPVS